jgi:hypothetical protein
LRLSDEGYSAYCIYIDVYYTLRFYFPYLSLLAQTVNITLYGPGRTASFSIRFRNGTCIIILDKKYNIANSSCHFDPQCHELFAIYI